MLEAVSTVGERGQVTIPKIIREKQGLKKKDKVLVKWENGKITMEKTLSKRQKEALMKERYIKYAKSDEALSREMEAASLEVISND